MLVPPNLYIYARVLVPPNLYIHTYICVRVYARVLVPPNTYINTSGQLESCKLHSLNIGVLKRLSLAHLHLSSALTNW